jgi:hypothetical protein
MGMGFTGPSPEMCWWCADFFFRFGKKLKHENKNLPIHIYPSSILGKLPIGAAVLAKWDYIYQSGAN